MALEFILFGSRSLQPIVDIIVEESRNFSDYTAIQGYMSLKEAHVSTAMLAVQHLVVVAKVMRPDDDGDIVC